MSRDDFRQVSRNAVSSVHFLYGYIAQVFGYALMRMRNKSIERMLTEGLLGKEGRATPSSSRSLRRSGP